MTGLASDHAVVGIAESDVGYVPGYSAVDLMAQATMRALADAGIRREDVDGVFATSAHSSVASLELAEYLQLTPRYLDSTILGGASFVAYVGHAIAAIEAGKCEVALIAYGSSAKSDRKGGQARPAAMGLGEFEGGAGALFPISLYALVAARHMHEFGTTSEQLARVVVASRKWASMNPKAERRDAVTVQEVLSSPMLSTPLHVLDCCLVSDGGGAVIVTTADRAARMAQSPVSILGTAESTSHLVLSEMPSLGTSAATTSGAAAFDQAGVGPADMDFAQLYDAFTINVPMFLEDLGFCAKGDAGAFIEAGQIDPDGSLPVNTNGGGLSFCHPGMYGIFTLIEATRQLRGQGGERQVDGARLGVAHGSGGIYAAQCTCVLGREA